MLTVLLTTEGTDLQETPPRITEKDAVEQDMDVDRADVLTSGKPRMAFHAAFIYLLITISLAPKDDALKEDMGAFVPTGLLPAEANTSSEHTSRFSI